MTRKPLYGVDLFCGAGGTSTGFLKAAASLGQTVKLTAINHWTTAVNTHELNHPDVVHLCENVETVNPRAVVPGGHLHALLASCECTFHSNARGGGPCNDQSRSQPWQIIRWITDLTVDKILMENVPEFQNWCRLLRRGIRWKGKYHKKDRPDPRYRGEYFRSFVDTLRTHGYNVEYRIQDAADFGDATHRRRLMLIASRTGPVVWPEPTHGSGCAAPYKTAREIIDWTHKGNSIFSRKKSLSDNTLARIKAGLEMFGGQAAEPFLVILNGTTSRQIKSSVRSLDEPLGTIAGNGSHHMLVEPTPFLAKYHGNHAGRDDSGNRVYSLDEPLGTIDTSNRFALIEPIIVRTDQTGSNGHCCQRIDQPLSTVVSKQNMLLVEPVIAKYYGTGGCKSVDEPLDTITTKDRFLLVEPQNDGEYLDILIRMLQPEELQLAHSFGSGYKFTGTKADRTKQIGNSVPVELARAHAAAILS